MHPLISRRDPVPINPYDAVAADALIASNAMLEIGASQPFSTVHPPRFNSFVPDAQMLFHVLGTCDQFMGTTRQFLRSCPSWLPIVSQLYISLLWNFTILRNFVSSRIGIGSSVQYVHILKELDFVNRCMIHGPLVPFFQSLASFNGRLFDITPIIPDFNDLWNASGFHPNADYARQIPIPAIILDQLYHFATYNNDDDCFQFQWYSNVFSQRVGEHNKLNRIGPQLCSSLFAPRQQSAAARAFWSSAFATGFTRVDANAAPFTSIDNVLGFKSQFGNSQMNWFMSASDAMHKYSEFYSGSVPLSSILTTGLGAVAVRGVPCVDEDTRWFLYPSDDMIEPFTSGRFDPRRQYPSTMSVKFQHSEYKRLGVEAERYALVAHTNLRWPIENGEKNEWARINSDLTHRGDVWSLVCHRFSNPVTCSVHTLQFTRLIGSRFHLHYLHLDD